MSKKRVRELLVKKRTGQISLPERNELLQLLGENPEFENLSEFVDDFFDVPFSFEPKLAEGKVENALSSLKGKLKKEETPVVLRQFRLRYLKFMGVAASILLVLSAVWFFIYQNKENTVENNIVATQKGSKSSITLPDGSKVWINSDTRLTYPKSFGETNREVNLEGEAYFDVVKDKEHPFIVHTKTMDVRVLGTAFNVRAYQGEASTQTTLLRGAVEVYLKKEKDRKISLKPNEKIVVQNNYQEKQAGNFNGNVIPEISLSKLKRQMQDSTATETQWMNNKLVFDQETLSEIIPALERWYNVKITLNNKVSDRKFSGVFEGDALPDVLESLKLSGGFNYKTEKNGIVIY